MKGRIDERITADIIRKAVAGDSEALGIIYKCYYNYSVTLVKVFARKDKRKGLLSPEEEDILQDAWEETFEDIRKFRG